MCYIREFPHDGEISREPPTVMNKVSHLVIGVHSCSFPGNVLIKTCKFASRFRFCAGTRLLRLPVFDLRKNMMFAWDFLTGGLTL